MALAPDHRRGLRRWRPLYTMVEAQKCPFFQEIQNGYGERGWRDAWAHGGKRGWWRCG
ncbi:hypothetical protein V6Z12_A10G150800 [Gossypium hirsutum]